MLLCHESGHVTGHQTKIKVTCNLLLVKNCSQEICSVVQTQKIEVFFFFLSEFS